MTETKEIRKYQAKQIYASLDQDDQSFHVIDNGVVTVRDGVVVEVGKLKSPSSDVTDLGEVALIPGLTNAHTHLEFSCLEQPLGNRGMAFTDWLKLVIAWRFESLTTAAKRTEAIRTGIAESQSAGTVAIGEIGNLPFENAAYKSELDCVLFLERLTRNHEREPLVIGECVQFLGSVDHEPDPSSKDSSSITRAISPHAPYSVGLSLLKRLVLQSQKTQCPVAMHLAETREELELISNQSGPFVDFLQSIGAWFLETYEQGQTILDYLNILAESPRSLVVHGNYLSKPEIEFIAGHRDSMSVVYCPRTHAYFDHDKYPLHELLNAGINVAVGTDSRASNPDLSVFDELKFVKQAFEDLSDKQILKLGTANGVQGLGVASSLGTIQAGTKLNFNVVTGADGGSLFVESSKLVPMSDYARVCE